MTEKKRFALWAGTNVLDLVKHNYKADNCKTQSEYIEKAILFYTGYLNTAHTEAYLPRVLSDVLEGKLRSLGDRIASHLFKLSVGEAVTHNILAYESDISMGTLRELQGKCVQDVKRTNGKIDFEDALKFQKDL